MMKKSEEIFVKKPISWGLRGDPYLWNYLREQFSKIPEPKDVHDFLKQLDTEIEIILGKKLDVSEEIIYVKEFDKGGMSGGGISKEFWQKEAIPLLAHRYGRG